MSKIKRVIIIGGGMAGLTLSLALKKHGIESVVYEQYDHRQRLDTGLLLWGFATNRLKDLGVDMNAVGKFLEHIEIYGAKNELVAELPVGQVSREHGTGSYEINRRRLSELMEELLGDSLNRGCRCQATHTDGQTAVAEFEDGSTVEGDLLIGCDGAHSVVRSSLYPNVELEKSNGGGWGAVLPFHPPGLKEACHLDFWQPGTKCGIADIGNGECRWYVNLRKGGPSSESHKKESALAAPKHPHPVLTEAINATDDALIWITEQTYLKPLPSWHKGRVMLVGDAAHASTSHAAMGACTAITDAFELGNMIASDKPVKEVIQTFEDERKPIADEVLKKSKSGLSMSTSNSRIWAWFRDMAFRHMPEKQAKEITEKMVLAQESEKDASQ